MASRRIWPSFCAFCQEVPTFAKCPAVEVILVGYRRSRGSDGTGPHRAHDTGALGG